MSNDQQPERRVLSNTEQAGVDAMKEVLRRFVGTELDLTDGIWIVHPVTGERCEISKSEGGYVVGAVVRP